MLVINQSLVSEEFIIFAMDGMRLPLNSEGDSIIFVGEKDLDLAHRLSKAGTDHSKYLRQIPVLVSITAPRYWWTEFDTYKVGTTANSESTMHTIHKKELTEEDFSWDEALGGVGLSTVVELLNLLRDSYLVTNNKDDWRNIIQLLPQSFNQTRVVSLNYQVLKTMYHARKNHKLSEWHEFCRWVESLPYAKEMLLVDQ